VITVTTQRSDTSRYSSSEPGEIVQPKTKG